MQHPPKRYTVTAALIYANGPIHIGHLAGCYIPADTYVRYLRAKGEDVVFVSGTDEHGVPITIKARKEGITPQQVVDKYHAQIKKAFLDFGISYDIYSRTSQAIHLQTSQEIFTTLYEKGLFIEETSEQYYDESAQQFLADRYIVGTCPVCGNPNAYGDQCERCGSTLSPTELLPPIRSALSGLQPVMRPTKNWYLPLDKMQPFLEIYIASHPEWKANVLGQCRSWLKDGLRPRAMTRDLEWGIKVPLPDTEGKVLYVWFDAPIGYISMTKEWAQQQGKDWQPYWKDQDTKLVHFIGKDNIVFHCLIFPAMLHGEGSYILPDNVPANEFMNLENDRISTSRNWAIWLHEYLETFPGKEDVLRYVLTANAPETKDSDFTWKDFQSRNNNELADNLGNFVNRVITLIHKYFEGKIPPAESWQPEDEALIRQLIDFPVQMADSIESFRFREALALLMEVSRSGNKYLADAQPWNLWKDPSQSTRVETILHLAAQVVANLAILSQPFLPFTSAKLFRMLGLDPQPWKEAGDVSLLKTGHALGEAEILFEKLEDAVIEAQVQKLKDTKAANEAAAPPADPKEEKALLPAKGEIVYDDFAKLDIRIATVIHAETVFKSDKLLKLTLQTGLDERIVLSGIAKHYKPEEVIGRQVCLLANLAPKKMAGIVSQGMILMTEDAEGRLVFVKPEILVPNGGTVS
jgi:methionyl-tRNA synthetase